MTFREDWESGEVGGQFGTAILDWLIPEGGRTRRRVEEAAGIERGRYMGYLDFLPDLVDAGLSYATTGEEQGPWSLEELSRRAQSVEDAGWTDAALSGHGGYELPARRRRRRRGCAPGYKRVSSCRCQCKTRRRRATGGRRRRHRKGRMPAALRRYWAKHRR